MSRIGQTRHNRRVGASADEESGRMGDAEKVSRETESSAGAPAALDSVSRLTGEPARFW
jgi:hypothetical protein